MRKGWLGGADRLALAIVFVSLSIPTTAGTLAHKVRKGDTLWDLAKKHHTTVGAIARANGISENVTLGLGKSIRIPTKDQYRKSAWAKQHARKTANLSHTVPCAASSPDNAQSDCAPIVRTALAYRGARYRRGGTSRGGFDCSGFTRHIFAKYGVCLPHSSRAQACLGTPVSRGELRSGDLVFFHTYRRGISHVGIYIGDSRFVHASTRRRGVTVDSLNASYYASRYRGARRVK